VIYLIFNEGYAPGAGAAVVRTELLEEALRLGRILAELLPDEPEVRFFPNSEVALPHPLALRSGSA